MDIRILVVDDDQDSVELVEKILKKDGYRVQTLTDGRKVDEEIRKNEIHLAVVDLKMPDISGLDATLLLKKDDQTKTIPIIAVTAFVTPADKTNALSSGCDAYIAKPLNMSNLLGTVETFLSSSSA